LNELNENQHDSDDQEHMNDAAHRVRSQETQKPENDQYDGNAVEHGGSPLAMIGSSMGGRR
jgi:hypothetical protein